MIRTESLTKRYGPSAAVDDVTLRLPRGSVVGLLGPNGAGKSTLLRILVGLARPTSGGGRVMGHDIQAEADAIRRAVALVPETKAIYPGVSAAEFVRFYLGFFGLADPTPALSLLERWGVDPGLRSEAMSPGARTKVFLAAVLARRPELMLLDEPTEGIDPQTMEDFWRRLMKRVGSEEDRGIVLATNRIEEAERICDRVVLMDGGRVQLQGETDAIRATWRRVFFRTRTGADGHADLPGVLCRRPRDDVTTEAVTSEWHPSVPARVGGSLELLDVRPMSLGEIYLTVVARER